jgi:hypothetical protein
LFFKLYVYWRKAYYLLKNYIPQILSYKNKKMRIDLGYMSVYDGEWSNGICYCDEVTKDQINREKCSPCERNLDPDQIVIPLQDIVVVYSYPFKDEFPHKHHTDNQEGFTRDEISTQIMARYAQMYQEEDQDVGPTGDMDPWRGIHILNRAESKGRYGIWGHHIGDLYLHSLRKSETKEDEYYIGIDS